MLTKCNLNARHGLRVPQDKLGKVEVRNNVCVILQPDPKAVVRLVSTDPFTDPMCDVRLHNAALSITKYERGGCIDHTCR